MLIYISPSTWHPRPPKPLSRSEASAIKGLLEKRATADAAMRRVIDQSVEHNWDVLRGIARQWEDHADFQREFKRHAWELDAAPAAAPAPVEG